MLEILNPYNHSLNTGGKLYFSCEIAHYGSSSMIFNSAGEIFTSGRGREWGAKAGGRRWLGAGQ